ncbi:MAG: anthranilate synthase component I, partial [Pseudomonadota bacterium]
MQVEPEFSVFAEAYRAKRPSVLWTRLVADLETPVSAMLKLAEGRPSSFLFESVEGGAVRGRYSFIGLKPDLIWRCRDDQAEINRRALTDPGDFEPLAGGALASLRRLIAESRIAVPPRLPPMAAGLFGYLGYEMVRLMEHLPDEKPDKLGVPDGIFLRPTVVAIFDNVEDLVTVVSPVRPQPGVDARAAYNQACERLAGAVEAFDRNLPQQD